MLITQPPSSCRVHRLGKSDSVLVATSAKALRGGRSGSRQGSRQFQRKSGGSWKSDHEDGLKVGEDITQIPQMCSAGESETAKRIHSERSIASSSSLASTSSLLQKSPTHIVIYTSLWHGFDAANVVKKQISKTKMSTAYRSSGSSYGSTEFHGSRIGRALGQIDETSGEEENEKKRRVAEGGQRNMHTLIALVVEFLEDIFPLLAHRVESVTRDGEEGVRVLWITHKYITMPCPQKIVRKSTPV